MHDVLLSALSGPSIILPRMGGGLVDMSGYRSSIWSTLTARNRRVRRRRDYWSASLNTLSTACASASSSNAGGWDATAEVSTSFSGDANYCCAGQNGGNPGGGGATDSANSSDRNDRPFTATRLESYDDRVEAANRRPYSPDNATRFPEEKTLHRDPRTKGKFGIAGNPCPLWHAVVGSNRTL
ncbi:hypothetical protein PHYSODRAFT_302057 [Phytophthora sojae]|uniref:Uncharacterized protein n=1 Tax=Phytophthora sojae (strain P6497) TaxID=1094619 RepID=G4ZL59_PHYSP|nr:hypothetical protein PHYSODRAFT_302057 [Phytophthora sojae]EGZ15573.1 hypothetical protein PHYSODRAFT_302057 [Phytophthora sojae]|eukprot:XP_009529322.1 hypothetical protein PHYSODRAFT_302057 [Phytophthora sojae]